MPWELLLLQPKLFSSTCRTKLMAWSGVAIEGKDLIHGKAAFCHALPFWPTWEDQDPFPWVVSPLPCHAVCLLHSLCRPSGNMAGSIVGNTWVRSGYRHNAQTPPQSRLLQLPSTSNKRFTLSIRQNEHSALPTPLFSCISNPVCLVLEL